MCSSLFLPVEQLEGIVVQAIRDNLNDPGWKTEIKETLARMLDAEFGTGAEYRMEEIRAEIAKISKEIENMIAAIRAGTFSQRLAAELKDAETRQKDLRLRLRQYQAKIGAKTAPEAIMAKILGLADWFDEAWCRCATPELKKDLVQGFVSQVNIVRDGPRLSADCWLWKIPQMPASRPSIVGERGTKNAPESIYLSGALRGLDLPLRERSLGAILPFVNVRRYDLLPLTVAENWRSFRACEPP